MPFAIVASTEEVKLPSGKTCRGRQYPWGLVQVENAAHCDFIKLREMLLHVNLEDLRESTHVRHYERYRQTRLQQMGFRDDEISLQVRRETFTSFIFPYQFNKLKCPATLFEEIFGCKIPLWPIIRSE
jgi:septin family protein